eukprot:1327554-Amorphochlora_amoeboformis.AAC.1
MGWLMRLDVIDAWPVLSKAFECFTEYEPRRSYPTTPLGATFWRFIDDSLAPDDDTGDDFKLHDGLRGPGVRGLFVR